MFGAYLGAALGWLLGTVYFGFFQGISIGIASGMLGAAVGGFFAALIVRNSATDKQETTKHSVSADQPESSSGV